MLAAIRRYFIGTLIAYVVRGRFKRYSTVRVDGEPEISAELVVSQGPDREDCMLWWFAAYQRPFVGGKTRADVGNRGGLEI